MKPFVTHKGIVAPLEAMNVDTDQIIPKQFLKRIERTGYEDTLFYDWRFLADGKTPDPKFEMNAPRYRGAPSDNTFGAPSVTSTSSSIRTPIPSYRSSAARTFAWSSSASPLKVSLASTSPRRT